MKETQTVLKIHQNHPLSSPLFSFCLATANSLVHAAVSSLSPVRFHTGTNWIIYVSRAGSAVAPLQLQSAGDKNGKLVHGREVEKNDREGRSPRPGGSGGGSVGKKGTGGGRSRVEHKDGTEEGECVVMIPTKAARQTAGSIVPGLPYARCHPGGGGNPLPPVIISLVSSWLKAP